MKILKTAALLLLVAAGTVTARGAVDYQSHNTPQRTVLVERFNAGDSTLTPGEVADVYYGAVFTDGFTPAGRDYAQINTLRRDRRYGEMKPLCVEALKADPTSLTLLFRTFAAAFNAPGGRDGALMESARTRINQICDAIFASGTGTTEDSPFEVACRADIEQFLTNFLQVDEILGMAEMGPLTVANVRLPGREEPAYLYFRVYRPN